MITRIALALILACGGCASSGAADWPLTAEVRGESKLAAIPSSFVIATYNISHQSRPADLRIATERLNADIWLLQEVCLPQHDWQADLSKLVPDGPWHFAVIRVNPCSGGTRTESQVIASRFPITRTEVWPLAPGGRRRRCALAAWIDLGGKSIVVVNTDHEPSFTDWRLMQDEHRAALMEHLGKIPDAAMLVGGDFNTCGNLWRWRDSRADAESARQDFRGAGFTPMLEQRYDSFFAWPIRMCLDHLFVRGLGASDAGVMFDASGSDHRPVWARVRLDP